MRVVLYMAISMNGKTTYTHDDTNWVETGDVERMDEEMKRCGAMIMGSGTYKSFGSELPIGKAFLVVMTHQEELLKTDVRDGIVFTSKSPSDVLAMLQDMGYEKVMLAGGEKLNTSFLNENCIDEIRVIVKPLILGDGKMLFELTSKKKQLKLMKSTVLDSGSIELSYEVQKN